MSRRWSLSIRARTAWTFALAAMALVTAALAFVNVASQRTLTGLDATVVVQDATPGTTADTAIPFVPVTPSTGSHGDAAPGPCDDCVPASFVTVVAEQQWQWSALAVVLAGALAWWIGWFVSRRVLRPIDRISATANRISATTLGERVALDGPDDELRRLSRTIDDLLDRLESAFESQRRFVAQASHELRTPLAVQRAALQIGLHDDVEPGDVRAVRAQMLEQNRRTEHLVDSLLVLAEADRGLGGSATALDLRAIADDAIAVVGRAGHPAGVRVTCDGRTGPPVGGRTAPVGEPTLVHQLLVNLVGNAVEYNVPDGFVRVTVDDGGFAVENSGPVVPADAAPLLVEPFRRCAEQTDGARHSGLGLSIVASIVHAHGWSLTITARASGGLLVRVDVSPM